MENKSADLSVDPVGEPFGLTVSFCEESGKPIAMFDPAEQALSYIDVMQIASGAAAPNCPKCGGQSNAPVRRDMSLPYKCTSCGDSFRVIFAMSDITQLKDVYAADADKMLANCSLKVVGEMPLTKAQKHITKAKP